MQKKVLILGGGPGGYSSAITLANLGLYPVIIEEISVGGTCLNRGCIPTKALLYSSWLYDKIKNKKDTGICCDAVRISMPDIINRKNRIVNNLRNGLEGLIKKRKIEIIRGKGRLINGRKIKVGDDVIEGDSIIVATGSEPLKLFNDTSVITSNEALDLAEIPDSLMIIGAGAVGIELACYFSELGSKVAVAEILPKILPAGPDEISNTLDRELRKKGIKIFTSTKIDKIENGEVFYADGTKEKYSLVLQTAGRKLNTGDIGLEECGIPPYNGKIPVNEYLETCVSEIYAVGDITSGSPMLAHSAFHQGIIAARNIAGEKLPCDLSLVPSCIYSHPEAAWAGKNEKEIPESKTGKILIRTLGRAHAHDEIEGFVKIIGDKKGRILGVQIVGSHASEMIHEGVLAIKMGACINDLADMIHAHPTFHEGYFEAALSMLGTPLHG